MPVYIFLERTIGAEYEHWNAIGLSLLICD